MVVIIKDNGKEEFKMGKDCWYQIKKQFKEYSMEPKFFRFSNKVLQDIVKVDNLIIIIMKICIQI